MLNSADSFTLELIVAMTLNKASIVGFELGEVGNNDGLKVFGSKSLAVGKLEGMLLGLEEGGIDISSVVGSTIASQGPVRRSN